MRRWLLYGCLAAMVGCSPPPQRVTSAARAIPPPVPEPWGVTCVDPSLATPAWLSNGLIGVRIGRDGVPNTLFRADSQTATGEERLSGEEVEAVTILVDGHPIEVDTAKPYRQRFDFKTLKLTTDFTSGVGGVRRSVVVNPGEAGWVERTVLTLARGSQVSVTSPPGARVSCKIRAPGIDVDLGPRGWVGTVPMGDLVVETTRLVGAGKAQTAPAGTDIEIDGPVEDQQAVRSFLAYLRMAIPASGVAPGPLSPHALSADHYQGHVFWDADVWVFPVLALTDPSRARSISTYRIRHLEAAKRFFASWWLERPREGNKQPGAAKFPWQSAISGLETAKDEFREEVHIDGAVLWGLDLAERLGLAKPSDVKEVEVACAQFWKSLLTPRPGSGQFDIKRVFGVDEFRSTDNDLITNVLAQWTMNGRSHQRPDGVPELYLPRTSDGSLFQTYEGDTQQTFKQAAAVLSIYPFQFPEAEAKARQMMDHYARRIDRRGPAMTEAIHATIWARLGERERAYEEWKRAWLEFTGPLLTFSEHRNRDRTYFVTGAAGCLQTVLYGFLGFRIDYRQVPDAVWSLQLKSGSWLSVKPNLPKTWKRVTVRNLQLLNRTYTLEITPNGVQVKEGES